MSKFTRSVAVVLALALVGAACGDDDGGNERLGEAADAFIAEASEVGIELDRDCTIEALGGLSEEDIDTMITGDPETSELSEEGDAILDGATDCVDESSVVDALVGQAEGEEGFDADCARENLEAIDNLTDLLADDPEGLVNAAMLECFTG